MDTKNNKFRIYKWLNAVFFLSMLFVEMLVLGMLGMVFKQYIDNQNLYQFISLALILLWIGLVFGYLAWAVYYYNINLGWTEEEWEDLKHKKSDVLLTNSLEVDKPESIPQKNPYEEHTFGLPPGTVRGIIAFTMLIGALSMMVYSMGLGNAQESALMKDHFEFFQNAFLMMVAFYFGSRGLEFLNKDKKSKEPEVSRNSESTEKSKGIELDNNNDPLTKNEDLRDNIEIDTIAPKTGVVNPENSPNRLNLIPKISIPKEYPTLMDEENNKFLTEDDIEKAASLNQLEKAAIKAVIKVETSGTGFLPDGRPRILFEGHIFWRELVKHNIDPSKYQSTHPDIIYPKWTKDWYKGGTKEYNRLEKAKLIHEEAALLSASWGLFQVMGFNFKLAGFNDVQDMVEKHYESEEYHLFAFLNFINSNQLVEKLRAKDWAAFALGYNGKGYKLNQYDTKLKMAYEKFKIA